MAKCGPYTYSGITQAKIDKMLQALKESGAKVTGNNPWHVDTNSHGVKLLGSWNSANGVLTIEVTDKTWYVPCSAIKDKLDSLIGHLSALADTQLLAASAGDDSEAVCGPWTYGNIDQARITLILAALVKAGATVTGNNPWDVDLKRHGIKLRGAWNPATKDLVITVTAKNFYVSCQAIKAELDKLMPHIASLPSAEIAEAQRENQIESAS